MAKHTHLGGYVDVCTCAAGRKYRASKGWNSLTEMMRDIGLDMGYLSPALRDAVALQMFAEGATNRDVGGSLYGAGVATIKKLRARYEESK